MITRSILHCRLRRGPLALSLHFALLSARPSPRLLSASSCNVYYRATQCGVFDNKERRLFVSRCFHTSQPIGSIHNTLEAQKTSEVHVSVDDDGRPKLKRGKLKGRRAVLNFVKYLRWRKKKEQERMTAEEKILFKLKKAREKEIRIVEALKKIEPPSDSSETTHDPEILTPEEHFYFLKMGNRCKNYVPVGRRGIFQGLILNMHLHWKKHQTLKVIVKTFTPEEVREIAVELARLSGGIVLDIVDGETIIMYRGKNYSQPPTEIMSPKVTLSRKKALDKSKYRDALLAVRRFIPRLEQDLEDLHEKMKVGGRSTSKDAVGQDVAMSAKTEAAISDGRLASDCVPTNDMEEDASSSSGGGESCSEESEYLSDIFSTDNSDSEVDAEKPPLYLDQVERFPSEDSGSEDFEERLREMSADAEDGDWSRKGLNMADLDEVDKIFLRAGSLLKKKR